MNRVTRDVQPAALRPLLERSTRGYLAFNDGDFIDATPVAFRFRDDGYEVGVSPELASRAGGAGTLVALLIDEGWYWYDLRSIRLRGTMQLLATAPQEEAAALTWFTLLPVVVVAWDYGTLREVQDDGSD